MAIVSCPECGASISDTAAACPNCGYALDAAARERPAAAEPVDRVDRLGRRPSIAGPILIIVLILAAAAFAAWYMGIIRFA
jgi:uncharacterized membrane protein YvbJ